MNSAATHRMEKEERMQTMVSSPKSGEGVWLWLLKILSGPVIFVLLGVHLVVNHLVAEGGLQTYASVIAYLANPWIAAMEIIFLVFVVTHALLGVRSILLDLKPSAGTLQAINWVFSLVGIGSILYGIWLIRAITARGAS